MDEVYIFKFFNCFTCEKFPDKGNRTRNEVNICFYQDWLHTRKDS